MKKGPPLPPEGTVARRILHNIASLYDLSDNDVNLHNLNGYDDEYKANSAILTADPVYQKLEEVMKIKNGYYTSAAQRRMQRREMSEKEYMQLKTASVDDIASGNIRFWLEKAFLAKRRAKQRYSKRTEHA